jgi:RimJ/RimL family protein N-acetyltransferase
MYRADAKVEVRPAREQDVDAVVDLLVAVAADGRWIGMEAPVDTARRRKLLIEALNDRRSAQLVATADGRVIGQLGMELAGYGVADLGMVVAEEWRGRGVGSALLDAGIDWARGAGAHKVALQVWPHNQAAIGLYEKFGFVREGVLRRHYRRRNGELWDAVVMGLQLAVASDACDRLPAGRRATSGDRGDRRRARGERRSVPDP